MNLNLNNKVVIVTGGAKGIGEGIVRSFAAEEAIVIVVNRSTKEGLALVEELKSNRKNALFIQADLTKEEDCRKCVEETVTLFGRIDILVNNAGVNDSVGLDRTPSEFMESVQNNLFHYYAVTHFALHHLKQSGGVIINIGSKVSVTGQGNTSGYAASKGGINSLTREWAVDLAPYGIRVNAVLPAEVMTPLYERWLQTLGDPEGTLKKIENLIPLGHRMTTKEEIADMVVFLSSDRSSHTTGQILFVDGGYTHFDRKVSVET